MFFYIRNKEPKLEVQIAQNYTETDIQRIILFIDALVNNPKMKVTFKLHPSTKNKFSKTIETITWHPSYTYNIKENKPNE